MKKLGLWMLAAILLCGSVVTFVACRGNSLEDIIGNSDNATNLARLADAIKNNASVTIQYSLYGDTDPRTATFKFNGTSFDFDNATIAIPAGMNYKLRPELEYTAEDGGFIYFRLFASQPAAAGTRTAASDPTEKIVLFVAFGIQNNEYYAYGVPGFTFKVMKVENLDVDIKNLCPNEAKIDIKLADGVTDALDPNTPFIVSYSDDINKWLDVANDYTGAFGNNKVLGVFGDYTTGDYQMYVTLCFYEFIYGDNVTSGNYFAIYDDKSSGDKATLGETITNGKTYTASYLAP